MAERFQLTLYESISLQLSKQFAVRSRRLFATLGNSSKVVNVFHQFLELADGKKHRRLLTRLIRNVLQFNFF